MKNNETRIKPIIYRSVAWDPNFIEDKYKLHCYDGKILNLTKLLNYHFKLEGFFFIANDYEWYDSLSGELGLKIHYTAYLKSLKYNHYKIPGKVYGGYFKPPEGHYPARWEFVFPNRIKKIEISL
jgi:hypothetical protein